MNIKQQKYISSAAQKPGQALAVGNLKDKTHGLIIYQQIIPNNLDTKTINCEDQRILKT